MKYQNTKLKKPSQFTETTSGQQQHSRLTVQMTLIQYLKQSYYTLSGLIGMVVASHAAVARSSPAECTDLYYAPGAQGVLPMRVGGATSKLDLPSLTPLSVACCG